MRKDGTAYNIAEIFPHPLGKTPASPRGWVPSMIFLDFPLNYDFPLRSDLLARSREIRRLRVIACAVLDDQLTRLRSGHRRTEGSANRARRLGV